ncbi:MAG TPA: T9SS type A sorting domain-containing protein, partial [Ignavibacteriaceae bacterium]
WQTASGQDANSVSKEVFFVSTTDLHLTGSSNGDFELAGTPIAGFTTDIDGDTRSTTDPYKGADEASLPVPVELVAFNASLVQGDVVLTWKTATEINNRGFEIERGTNGEFATIGFISGSGTSTQEQSYTFIDKEVAVGIHTYRLKQIDFDGSYSYSNIIEVDVTTPLTFSLSQNYPNPFNPTTKISYSVPFDSKVIISVYSVTGELVMELVNDNVSAGSYSVDFNGSNLASGMYIYKMTAGSFTQSNKMMLMK